MTRLSQKGVSVGAAAPASGQRGIPDELLTPGAHRASLEERTEWTLRANRTITF